MEAVYALQLLSGRQGTELAVLPQSVRGGGRVLQSLDPMDGNWSDEVSAGGKYTVSLYILVVYPLRAHQALLISQYKCQCCQGVLVISRLLQPRDQSLTDLSARVCACYESSLLINCIILHGYHNTDTSAVKPSW